MLNGRQGKINNSKHDVNNELPLALLNNDSQKVNDQGINRHCHWHRLKHYKGSIVFDKGSLTIDTGSKTIDKESVTIDIGTCLTITKDQ